MERTDNLPSGYRMTELGPLPEEWRVVKLGEVAELKQGKTPRREQYDDKSGYRIIKVKDFEDGGKVSITPKGDRSFVRVNLGEVNKVKGADILILNSGHSSEVVGQKVGIVPRELEGAFYVAELTRIRAIEKKADNYFLFTLLMLDNTRDFIRGLVKGGHLYVSHLKSIPIPLPPLPEQKAIAYVLRTVQSAKEATEKVISSLRELKKSLMKHLFTYGPVQVDEREKVELREAEKDTGIGKIPAHWKVVRLGEVAELKQGKTPRREQYDDKSGYRIIKVKDFEDGGKVSITPKGDRSFVHVNLGEVNRVKGGDILILNSGHSSEVVGQKAGIVPKELEGAFYVAELTRIRAIEKKADNYFLFALLMLDNIRDCIRGLVKGGHLYVSHLKSIPIPLPPLEEQQQIAHILRTVDQKIEAEKKRKEALENLFKSLLHNLMTAKVRLPREFVKRFEEVNKP